MKPGLNFVAIDCETANSNPASICAVGIAVVKKGQIQDTFYTLVNPGDVDFEPQRMQYHEITKEMVKDAPTFDSIYKEYIQPLLKGGPFVAHHASADMSFLRHALHDHKLDWPDGKSYFCTLLLSRRLWPQLKSHGLNIMAEHLSLPLKHHNALSDAIACADIAITACQLCRVDSIEDLARVCSIDLGIIYNNRWVTCHHSKKSSPEVCFRDLTIDIPKQSGNCEDTLSGKRVVFTGDFKYLSRRQAIMAADHSGAKNCNTLSIKVDYLVLGVHNLAKFRGANKSKKHQNAEQLIEQGAKLKIINEDMFIDMIDSDLLEQIIKDNVEKNTSGGKITNRKQTLKIVSSLDNSASPIYKKRIALSGNIRGKTKNELEQFITIYGGLLRKDVSARTDYLVVSDELYHNKELFENNSRVVSFLSYEKDQSGILPVSSFLAMIK